MSKTDSIKAHINNIEHKVNILKDLGEPLIDTQVITKIIMSLPLRYNSTVATWANVPIAKQTISAITTRLLQQEHIFKQQNKENLTITVYFTYAQLTTKKMSKLEKCKQDAAYLKELQSRTFCYNYGAPDHWSQNCTKPRCDNCRHHDSRHSQHNHSTHHSSCDHHHDKGK